MPSYLFTSPRYGVAYLKNNLFEKEQLRDARIWLYNEGSGEEAGLDVYTSIRADGTTGSPSVGIFRCVESC